MTIKASTLIFFYFFIFFILGCTQDRGLKTSVFRYNEHKNIGSLDPAFAKDNADIWAINQLFNGLVQMDEELHVQPCIAKEWTITEDALTYRFLLRKDVYFHKHPLFGVDSSRIVTANDF